MGLRQIVRSGVLNPVSRGQVGALSHDGRGIVRINGKAVFIEGALPGEDVDFHIVRRRREYDEARLLDIHNKSSERVPPQCEHFGVCGGCALQHLAPAAQITSKQQTLLDNLKRIGQVQPQAMLPPLTGPVWGYRRRARLSVHRGPSPEQVHVGFVEQHSKHVAKIRHCETLHPKIGNLIESLAVLIGNLTIAERIPQIEVAMGDNATILVLRILSQPDRMDRIKLSEFEQTHDLYFYLQPGKQDSTIPLGTERTSLNYSLPDWNVEITFEPADFIQINGEINRQLVKRAIEKLQVKRQHRVLDLFCGLGNFTLPLARVSNEVAGIESEPGLVVRACANAERNGLTNIRFYRADLFADQQDAVWQQLPYDRLLLDPPRAGALEILTGLGSKLPQRIVYISCHPATLARDAGFLVHARGYQLLSAGVLDMFPHTAYVESMAVFTHAGDSA